ncbi:MAG: hypothetical protein LBK82_05390 [Planctomycetaceae bacterium]|jgi:hypothetical protein|nr:hypothetical protein [Planctomycetaceae bacterium]
MNRFFYSIILLLIFLIGCDLAKPQGRKNESAETLAINVADLNVSSENTSPPQTDASSQESQEPPVAETELPKVEEEQPQKEEDKPKEPDAELVKADVGAGKKGHYGQTGGEQVSDILTVPIATLFRAKEMTAYRIQVPQALQLYKAMNDGKGPETHEVFMKDIIKANNIPLPVLPDGHEYIYDPATEQLMIKIPK